MALPLTDEKRVTLVRRGRSLLVTPAPRELVKSLVYKAHVAIQVNDGSLYTVGALRPFAGHLQDDQSLAVPSGLEQVARTALTVAGIACDIVNDEVTILPEPDLAWAAQFGSLVDQEVLDGVRNNRSGLIRCGLDVDRVRLIAQIALAWPTAKIAICVQSRRGAHDIAKLLRNYLADVSVITGRDNPAEVSRVVVTTYLGLGHSAHYRLPGRQMFDVSWLDLVIAFDAEEATDQKALQCVVHACRARLYGLSCSAAPSSPLERDLAASLFGFAEVVIPAHGCRERPVQVAHHRVEGGMQLLRNLDDLQLVRRGIWHHAVRNRRVAQLAKAFADRDQATIVKILDRSLVLPHGCQVSVVVLAASIKHLLVLHRLLPDWTSAVGSDVQEADLPPKVVQVLGPHPLPFFQGPWKLIATPAGFAEIDLNRFDVVIRADAGAGLPPITDQMLAEPASYPAQPLLLIDCHDRHHPVLRQRSRSRFEAYQKRGWFPIGVAPEQGRVERFLMNRPLGVRT